MSHNSHTVYEEYERGKKKGVCKNVSSERGASYQDGHMSREQCQGMPLSMTETLTSQGYTIPKTEWRKNKKVNKTGVKQWNSNFFSEDTIFFRQNFWGPRFFPK